MPRYSVQINFKSLSIFALFNDFRSLKCIKIISPRCEKSCRPINFPKSIKPFALHFFFRFVYFHDKMARDTNGTNGEDTLRIIIRYNILDDRIGRPWTTRMGHVRLREGQFRNGVGFESHRCAPRQISRQFPNNITYARGVMVC